MAETLQEAAKALEPHRLAHFLMNLVGTFFHGYYTRNRKAAPVVNPEDPGASQARLLCARHSPPHFAPAYQS